MNLFLFRRYQNDNDRKNELKNIFLIKYNQINNYVDYS